MKNLSQQISVFVTDYAALLLLGAGLFGIVLLAGLAIWAKRTEKPLRPLALALSMNLALLLNAEGMWVIAVDQLKLPPVFAVLVFAVFEICFLTATSLAAEQYRRTTVYGLDGKIITPGHPGPMLYIAALIAAVSGVIVASNAVTGTEKLLRLAVPCVIFLMWWAALTAAGQKLRRSKFAYSPRRLAERWGWLIPDDDPDLVKMAADRQVRRMVVNYQRVNAGRWPKAWWRSRLLKDARTAGETTVAEVVEQLARIQRVMGLLVPVGQDGQIRPVSAQAEVGERGSAQRLSAHEAADEHTEALVSEFAQALSSVPEPPAQPVPLTDAVTEGHRDYFPEGYFQYSSAARPGDGERLPVFRSEPAEPPVPNTAIVGSPWWRISIECLARLVTTELGAVDLAEMTLERISAVALVVSPRVPELGETEVRAFVDDYVRALRGEFSGSEYPWRDFLPAARVVVPSQEVSPSETTEEIASADARMRAYWDREVEQGRVPTGADLARVGGVSPATGRRRRTEWERQSPREMPRELVETGRSS